MSLKLLSLFVIFGAIGVQAANFPATARWIRGADAEVTDFATVLDSVQPGDVLVLGEQHGNAPIQEMQVQILQGLRDRGHRVNVAMEFLDWQVQESTDQYRAGTLSEPDFLKIAQWGSIPFDLYRRQVLFPNSANGESTFAINAPRSITSKVAKSGIGSLTEEDRRWLPRDLTRGNDSYYRRFMAQMPHLPNPEAGENYFWSQSIWDDTMAWNVVGRNQALPDHVTVILVGEFHVQYGGGLPDRLRARGAKRVITISQLDLTGLTPEEQTAEIAPHRLYGPRADWIWAF